MTDEPAMPGFEPIVSPAASAVPNPKDKQECVAILQWVLAKHTDKKAKPKVWMTMGVKGHGKSTLLRWLMFLLSTCRAASKGGSLRVWGDEELPVSERDGRDGTFGPMYYLSNEEMPGFVDVRGIRQKPSANDLHNIFMLLAGYFNHKEVFTYDTKHWWFWRWFVKRSPPADGVLLCHRACEVFPSDRGTAFLDTWEEFLSKFKDRKWKHGTKVVVVLTFESGIDNAFVRGKGTPDTRYCLRAKLEQIAAQNPDYEEAIRRIPLELEQVDDNATLAQVIEAKVRAEKTLCDGVYDALSALGPPSIPEAEYESIKDMYMWPTVERNVRLKTYVECSTGHFPLIVNSPVTNPNEASVSFEPDPWIPGQWYNSHQAALALQKLYFA